ncbi:MAG: hypothetical protein RLN81_15650 [Balneolaceae bacterium]
MEGKEIIVGNTDLREFEYSGSNMARSLEVDDKGEPIVIEEIDTYLKSLKKSNYIFEEKSRESCNPISASIVSEKIIPHVMICKLIVIDFDGDYSVGTGFFISPRCLITSGHNVYSHHRTGKGWATKIIALPCDDDNDRHFGYSISEEFRSVSGFVDDDDKSFDYGAVIFPTSDLYRNFRKQFNYGVLTENDNEITCCGYKDAELYRGKQSLVEGPYNIFNDYFIKYSFDTDEGNSGSPLYIKDGQNYKVVGVHRGGSSCEKDCVRVREQVIKNWNIWTNL